LCEITADTPEPGKPWNGALGHYGKVIIAYGADDGDFILMKIIKGGGKGGELGKGPISAKTHTSEGMASSGAEKS